MNRKTIFTFSKNTHQASQYSPKNTAIKRGHANEAILFQLNKALPHQLTANSIRVFKGTDGQTYKHIPVVFKTNATNTVLHTRIPLIRNQ